MKIGDIITINDKILDSTEYDGVDAYEFLEQEAVIIRYNPKYDSFNYEIVFSDRDVQKYAEKMQCELWDIEHMEVI